MLADKLARTPNPKTAAIKANTKNINVQPNMALSSFQCYTGHSIALSAQMAWVLKLYHGVTSSILVNKLYNNHKIELNIITKLLHFFCFQPLRLVYIHDRCKIDAIYYYVCECNKAVGYQLHCFCKWKTSKWFSSASYVAMESKQRNSLNQQMS